MKPHLEVLDAAQAAVLRRMGVPMARDGFHLAGGTAVALDLGHRRSVHLDWLTPSPLADPLAHAGRRAEGIALTDVEAQRGTLHARVEGVRVSLIEYRYPLLGDTGGSTASPTLRRRRVRADARHARPRRLGHDQGRHPRLDQGARLTRAWATGPRACRPS